MPKLCRESGPPRHGVRNGKGRPGAVGLASAAVRRSTAAVERGPPSVNACGFSRVLEGRVPPRPSGAIAPFAAGFFPLHAWRIPLGSGEREGNVFLGRSDR